jgi:signal transduction histidine kinase
LVNDLIQISGIDTETPRFSGEKVDLAEVFDNVLAKAAESLQNEDVSLRIDFPAQLPYLVTDPVAISQALLDLVENACEITPPEGEIGLSARLEKDDDGHESYILIRVSDQGGGIAAEDIPHVFSPNMMEENRTIVGIGTRGDALPVVKALVEALGGRIWVDSKPGIGSTFSLLMPVTTQETGIRPTEGE